MAALPRAGGVEPVLRNSAAEMPRFWHHLFNRQQPGGEHDYRATFLTLLDTLGAAGTFRLIPEPKSVTLEHIERKLMSGEKLRNIGNELQRLSG